MKVERQGWFSRLRTGNLALGLLAMALMVPDVGHAGYLFAAREAGGREWIGYVLALCVDATFAVAFREIGRVRQWGRRAYAIAVALLACTVNGGFNVGYYRDAAPRDPLWLSLMLGASAPVLATLLSVMQAFERMEVVESENAEVDAQRAYDLEVRRLELEMEVKKAGALEVEKTRQLNAQVRLARVQREAQEREAVEKVRITEREAQETFVKFQESLENFDTELRTLRVALENPDARQEQIAEILGCSRRTVVNHLGRLEQAGIITKDGKGIELSELAKTAGLDQFDRMEKP